MKTPWGMWEVLAEEPDYKVKRILVNSGHRLSYQKHSKREERWLIVKGTARVTLDGRIHEYPAGSLVHIPFESAHRIENQSGEPLVFIEVQTGSYFGEDDIVRLEDDYGRV
jgi:mannose-6-phosphate isomerase